MKIWPCLLIIATSLLCLSEPSQAENWAVDPARSKVAFVYHAMGADIQGEFNRYSAKIDFHPSQPEKSTVNMVVYTPSIDAGLPEATTEALTANFLDTGRYPKAIFVSRTIKPLGQQRYQITGELDLKNIRRQLTFVARLKPEGNNQRMDGTLKLNRLDFAIGAGMWSDTSTLGNEVGVAFSLLLKPGGMKR